MSGSPKYSSVSYSASVQRQRERERDERERAERQRAEALRRAAEVAERSRQAAASAGALAAASAELEHVQRGLPFAPAHACAVATFAAEFASAQVLHQQGRFDASQRTVDDLARRLSVTRRAVEQEAERLALRAATVQALAEGLRARGYSVGDPLPQADGTVAIRAELAGAAGLDAAVVAGTSGDQLVLQRHGAVGPGAAITACPSLVALHRDLRTQLAAGGIELGELWWDDEAEERAAAHSVPRQVGRGA